MSVTDYKTILSMFIASIFFLFVPFLFVDLTMDIIFIWFCSAIGAKWLIFAFISLFSKKEFQENIFEPYLLKYFE